MDAPDPQHHSLGATDTDAPTGAAEQSPAEPDSGPEGGTEADAEPEVLTGRRLAQFRVREVIGRGGMGILYDGHDVHLDRRVALKVISPLWAADSEFRDQFRDEARNTSAVDHPHVVPLYDQGETDDGYLWIAMRHVDGQDLRKLVGDRPLHPRRALALFDQVADALDAVHASGLIHLDVKPSNVLVTGAANGGREHVYLADFGLTRRSNSHRSSSGFRGSPAYASPEHLQGERLTSRADLYSLACCVFHVLAGRAPHVGSVAQVVDGHLDGRPPAVHLVRGEAADPGPGDPALTVGPRASTVLARALALDPDARPRSARELLGQLRAAMEQDARPAPIRQPPIPPAAREAAPAAGGALPAIPAGSTHAELAPLRTRTSVRPADIGAFDRGSTTAPIAAAAVAAAVLAIVVLVLALL